MSDVITPEVVRTAPTAEQSLNQYMNADLGAAKARLLVLGATSGVSLLYGISTKQPATSLLGVIGLGGTLLEFRSLQAKSAVVAAANDALVQQAFQPRTYAVGTSHLSPDDLARVKEENRALFAASESRQRTAMVFGGLAALGGLALLLSRRRRRGEN